MVHISVQAERPKILHNFPICQKATQARFATPLNKHQMDQSRKVLYQRRQELKQNGRKSVEGLGISKKLE